MKMLPILVFLPLVILPTSSVLANDGESNSQIVEEVTDEDTSLEAVVANPVPQKVKDKKVELKAPTEPPLPLAILK